MVLKPASTKAEMLTGNPPLVCWVAILYLDEVSVSFDGFKAINKLSLDISVGELRCIIGPNGAGKTTMMDIITGKTRPDSGTAFFGSTINLLSLTEPQIADAESSIGHFRLRVLRPRTIRAALFQ